MRFVYLSKVYIVQSLDEVLETLQVGGDELKTVLAVLYSMTIKALHEDIDTLLNLGTIDFARENEDILSEINDMRAFLIAVESNYPDINTHINEINLLINQGGSISLDGESLVLKRK